MFIGTSSLQAGEESVEITFIQAVGAVDNMEIWYGDTQRRFEFMAVLHTRQRL